ncbi:MAG: PrgI family protein [Patescibacteria group bacterium]|nr:PrgI family protein [Patescibacteria group bacterium]
MRFNVPQFISIEDKIAFQLTAKQLGWFALGGVILFFIWQVAIPAIFFVWVFIIGALALAFAFVKPYGIPFLSFLVSNAKYLIRPKVLVWERKVKEQKDQKAKHKTSTRKKAGIDRFMKEKELKKVDDFASVLDKQSKI